MHEYEGRSQARHRGSGRIQQRLDLQSVLTAVSDELRLGEPNTVQLVVEATKPADLAGRLAVVSNIHNAERRGRVERGVRIQEPASVGRPARCDVRPPAHQQG